MKQVFHIFAKDVRRLWLVIALSQAAVALVAWDAWIQAGVELHERWYNIIAPLFLLAFCWCLLIGRAIHEEVLVGDRQFWITRPYRWQQLMLSKLLFIVTFTYIPSLLALCALLQCAGFPFTHHLAATGEAVAIATAIVVPAIAAAVLTRQLGHYLAVIIAMVATAIGFGLLSDRLPNVGIPASSAFSEVFQVGCFLLLLVVCIFMQYRRRHTGKSASMAIAAFVLVPINMWLFPYGPLLEHTYPVRTPDAPIALMVRPLPFTSEKELIRPEGEDVVLGIPAVLDGMTADEIVVIGGAMMTVTEPDGTQWQTQWQQAARDVLPPRTITHFDLKVPTKVYERYKSAESKVQLSLAYTVLKDSGQVRMTAQPEFRVPGVGVCRIAKSGELSCRAALDTPEYLLVRTMARETTCEHTDYVPSAAVGQYLSKASSNVPITPFAVHRTTGMQWNIEGIYETPKICLGTPVVFSTPQIVSRQRIVVDVGTIRLANYRRE